MKSPRHLWYRARSRRSTTLHILSVLLVSLTISARAATTWYVDNAYGDAGFDGSSAVITNGHGPKRYVTDAIAAASDGDLIVTANGFYEEFTWDTGGKSLTLLATGQSAIVESDPGQLDTDGDNIPDWWMLKYFGHPTGQTNDLSCANCDYNGDGLSNLQEYHVGWNPTNSCSSPVQYTADYQTNIVCSVVSWEGGFSVGSNTFADVLLIRNDGILSGAIGYVGYEPASSNNMVLITGAGSAWKNCDTGSNGGRLVIGQSGTGNTLVISNGGFAYNDSDGVIGSGESSSNNSVLVTGAGSAWTNYWGCLFIGLDGAGNSLVISDGGNVMDDGPGVIGTDESSSNNFVLVTGSNSVWDTVIYDDQTTFIGYAGAGNSLVVSNGGYVYGGGSCGYLGETITSSGNLLVVTGTNSEWASDDFIQIGDSGAGNRVVVRDGGLLSSGHGYLGSYPSSSNNSVLVTDPGSVWSNNYSVVVGQAGAANSVVISNGGWLVSSANVEWYDLGAYIGGSSSSSNNCVLVTGSGSVWSNSGSMFVGFDGDYSSLVINDGGAVTSTNLHIGHGDAGATNCVVTVNGGTLTVADGTGDGLLEISGGTLTLNADSTVTADFLFMPNGPSSTLVYNGGTLALGTAEILNGSVLEIALGPNTHRITVSGNLTLDATLNIIDAGGFTNGTYTLFTYGGALTYDGVIVEETPMDGLSYTIDTNTPHEVKLTFASFVEISSPTNGGVASGMTTVQVSVTNIVDSLALIVDGNYYSTITNPLTSFQLPTMFFSNGVHTIAVTALHEDLSEDTTEITSTTVQVSFQNDITVEWFDAFQTSLPIIANLSYAPADWTITITAEDGTPVKTLSGSASDGNINTNWDATDDSDNPVPYSALYFVTISASPQSGYAYAAAGSSSTEFASYREEPWYTEATLLVREKYIDGGLDSTVGNVLNNINQYINEACSNSDVMFSAPLVMAQDGDWSVLLYYLTDYRPRTITQLYYYGHGLPTSIGFMETTPNAGLFQDQVSKALQNNYAPYDVPARYYNTPYKFVFLDACDTAYSVWSEAFGIKAAANTDYSVTGRKNRAFLGWQRWSFANWQTYNAWSMDLWQSWTGDANSKLIDAEAYANRRHWIPQLSGPTIYGYPQLTWGE